MKAFTRILNPGTVHWGDETAAVYVEVKYDAKGELHIVGVEGPRSSGNAAGGAGQIVLHWTDEFLREQMTYDPKRWTLGMVMKLRDIWERWHLNHMNAGTPTQEEWVRAHYGLKHPEVRYDYSTVKEELKAAGLDPDPDSGYEYGTGWLKENVPDDVLEWLKGLPESTRTPAWV